LPSLAAPAVVASFAFTSACLLSNAAPASALILHVSERRSHGVTWCWLCILGFRLYARFSSLRLRGQFWCWRWSLALSEWLCASDLPCPSSQTMPIKSLFRTNFCFCKVTANWIIRAEGRSRAKAAPSQTSFSSSDSFRLKMRTTRVLTTSRFSFCNYTAWRANHHHGHGVHA
jgi:hypothetical protein